MTDMHLGWFVVSLDVKDMARSLEFYKKLGFRQVDGDAESTNVTLQKGDCRIGLYQGHLDPPETQLIFWQGDIDAIAGALADNGLQPERDINDAKGGRGVLLKDPDGHPLYFVNLPDVTQKSPA
jgi:lactoylglutathione lyase